MEKSAQWMTLQELRDELDRTRPAWDELADLDDVLQDGELTALSEDARRLLHGTTVATSPWQRQPTGRAPVRRQSVKVIG